MGLPGALLGLVGAIKLGRSKNKNWNDFYVLELWIAHYGSIVKFSIKKTAIVEESEQIFPSVSIFNFFIIQ